MLLVAVALAVAAGGTAPDPEAPDVPRAAHTATLLASGDVLVAGGCTVDSCELDARGATTEIYDTESRRFHDGPQLLRPRVGHAAAGGAPTHELERVGVRRTAAREVPIDRDRRPLRRYADRRSGA